MRSIHIRYSGKTISWELEFGSSASAYFLQRIGIWNGFGGKSSSKIGYLVREHFKIRNTSKVGCRGQESESCLHMFEFQLNKPTNKNTHIGD